MDRKKFLDETEKSFKNHLVGACRMQNLLPETLEQLRREVLSTSFFDKLFYQILAFFKDRVETLDLPESEKQALVINAVERAHTVQKELKDSFAIAELIFSDARSGSFLVPNEASLNEIARAVCKRRIECRESSGNKIEIFDDATLVGTGFFETVLGQ